jgi:hypothetical protein
MSFAIIVFDSPLPQVHFAVTGALPPVKPSMRALMGTAGVPVTSFRLLVVVCNGWLMNATGQSVEGSKA